MNWKKIKWWLRGKPTKKVIGGWCGLCGKWLPNAEFTFPDYWKVDNFWDRNSICPDKCINRFLKVENTEDISTPIGVVKRSEMPNLIGVLFP